MIDWLNTIDTQAFLALNGLHAPYFDAFMKLFTGKWIWVPMYAAVLFAVVRNYRWRQTLAVLVCVALAITIADQVCATLIRPEVCRLRPSNPENPLSEMVHIVGGYRRFLRLPVVSRSQFVRSCLILDIAVCQPQTQSFHFCVGGA